MKQILPLPAYLVDRYQGWRASKYQGNQAWYANLAASGQHPRAMVIACCDSRVDAHALFGAEPGELFMLRNVANLVPPYGRDEALHGSSAAIDYAVQVLRVAHIIVLGHSHCGGVKAYYDKQQDPASAQADTSPIDGWLQTLAPAYARLTDTADVTDPLRQLEQQGILNSIDNLMNFPSISAAVANKLLSLHASWFDIGSGQLYCYNGKEFAPI